MVSSECEPFAKTGGLADVVDALARALGRLGHRVDVYLPRYRDVAPPPGAVQQHLSVPIGMEGRQGAPGSADVLLWSGPADGYRIRLVDHPPSFDRAGLYGEHGRDHPDNAARFALLGRAALQAVAADGEPLDVVHGHDWQAGPVLLALAQETRHETLARTATVLTCHNLAFHGWVPPTGEWRLGLMASPGSGDGVDLLREGIGAADVVNTVSPTYARESLTPAYGGGLDAALRELGDRYVGILNGIDRRLWDPATDASLAARFDLEDTSGKALCRADLATRHGLDPTGPILGMIGRLDPQKGFDLVAGAARGLLSAGARLVILGTGDAALLAGLRSIAGDAPDRVVLLERFDHDEARRIYAGSDIFLMPSRFEPSGQGQLIALRYGAVPLVRATGGLADTVRDADAHPRTGNGFTFGRADPDALLDAAKRAVAAWGDGARWQALVRRGMAEDHGWERPAREYEALYQRALARARPRAAAPCR
jgi:starch synthase